MHELLKVPHLLSHYVEHTSQSKEISLVDFLKEHYNGSQNNHTDDHKDRGCLPFQGKEHVNPITNLMLQNSTDLVFLRASVQENFIVLFQENFISSFNGSVWQPPKIS